MASIPREESGFDTAGARSPVWIKRDDLLLPSTQPAFPKLTSNTSSDVLVVGGGFAGLHIAYELLNKGKKVIVIDDGKIGSGDSGRYAGILDVDNKLNRLSSLYDAETLSTITESQQKAISHISSIISTHSISCDHQTLPSYLFSSTSTTSTETPSDLLDIFTAAKAAKALTVSLVDDAGIKGFMTGKALKVENQGALHVTKYLKGLAGVVKTLGGEIYEGSRYVNHKEVEGKVLVDLEGDIKVVAADLVFATQIPPQKIVMELASRPYRTYLIALRIPTSSISTLDNGNALYGDTSEPRHYVRFTPSKEEGTSFLVVGGEDAKVGQHNDGEERFAKLEAWARERWSDAGAVEYKWSTQVIATHDGIIYSGRNPGEDHVYLHTADNGHPLTNAAVGGMIISDLIVKGDHPWAKTFCPSRQHSTEHAGFALSTVPKVLGEYLGDQTYLAKWATMATKTMTDIEDLVPGEGEVVREGITPLAVYKDEGGEIHKMSAICPHLKGIVSWNSTEKSWDCPLHGSRFTCKGALMNGPSRTGLVAK